MPVAVNCWVPLTGMKGMAGVTSIESSAGVTVSAVFALTPPELADTVVLPVATLVARPPLLTVATPAAEELQVTEPVRSAVLPFE